MSSCMENQIANFYKTVLAPAAATWERLKDIIEDNKGRRGNNKGRRGKNYGNKNEKKDEANSSPQEHDR